MAVIDPRKHLNEAQRAELRSFSEDLKAAMESVGYSEEEKKACYDILMEYEVNDMAKETARRHYNALLEKLGRIKKRYESEPDDRKAQQYLEQYNKNKAQLDIVKKRYDTFRDNCLRIEHRAVEQDEKLTAAVQKKDRENQNSKVKKQ